MRIAMGSDHAAFELRRQLQTFVEELGHQVVDLGTDSVESTDYPIYGARVGKMVAAGECDVGIALCGSGVGISIAANRIPGIRAVVCSEPYTARMSRRHNDTNVLAMGGRVVGVDLAKMIVEEWLAASYEGGRHARRVAQLGELSAGHDIE